jgi:hypothetical protein
MILEERSLTCSTQAKSSPEEDPVGQVSDPAGDRGRGPCGTHLRSPHMRPARICHEHEIFKGRSMHTGTVMSSATRLKNIGRKRLGRILRTTIWVRDADVTCLACTDLLKGSILTPDLSPIHSPHRRGSTSGCTLHAGQCPIFCLPEERGVRVNRADTLSDCYGISLGTGRDARRRALRQNIRGQGRKTINFFPM